MKLENYFFGEFYLYTIHGNRIEICDEMNRELNMIKQRESM